jgi:hypothetical protein
MFEKYNCILRRWPEEAYTEMVNKGATYTTTIHVLVSAVQKLAAAIKMPDGLKLYRGLGGVIDLPPGFFKPHANGGKGFTEWGFMSTTSEKHVAIQYSGMGGQVALPMVLEMTVNAVDRGACIRELSQYPQEVEYLWVPCSFVAPGGPERLEVTDQSGVVRIVPVRVNSNLAAPTLEQMLHTKKHVHVAAFRYMLQELQRDLSDMCNQHGPARLQRDYYKTFNKKHSQQRAWCKTSWIKLAMYLRGIKIWGQIPLHVMKPFAA